MSSKRILLAIAASALAAAAATLALPSPAVAAGGPYRAAAIAVSAPAASPDVTLIPDTYIVSMKPGIAISASLKALALSPQRTFGAAVNGYTAKLTKAQLKALSHNGDVLAIEQDAWHTNVVDTTQANPPAWGIDRIDQVNLPLSASYTYTATGAGVH